MRVVRLVAIENVPEVVNDKSDVVNTAKALLKASGYEWIDSGVLHTGSTDKYLIPNANQCLSCHSREDAEPGSAPIASRRGNGLPSTVTVTGARGIRSTSDAGAS